jgi:hypothetical protein
VPLRGVRYDLLVPEVYEGSDDDGGAAGRDRWSNPPQAAPYGHAPHQQQPHPQPTPGQGPPPNGTFAPGPPFAGPYPPAGGAPQGPPPNGFTTPSGPAGPPPQGFAPPYGHPQGPPPQGFFQQQGPVPQGFHPQQFQENQGSGGYPRQPWPPPGAGGPRRRTGLILGGAAGAVLVIAAVVIVVVATRGHGSHSAVAAPAPRPAASHVPAARPTSTGAREPEYTRVPAPCGLVTSTTLAGYVPGGSAQPPVDTTLGAITTDNCDWRSQTPTEIRALDLTVTLDTFKGAASSDETDYTDKVGAAEQPFDGNTITGKRQLSGLGDQATVIYQSMGDTGGTEADLYVRSGNAIIDVTYICNARSGGRPPSQAKELAGSEAAARNVLAALPTS